MFRVFSRRPFGLLVSIITCCFKKTQNMLKRKKMRWSTSSPNNDTKSEHLSCILPRHPCIPSLGDKTNLRLCAFMRWNNQISQSLTQKPFALWCQSDVWWNDDTVMGGKRRYGGTDGWWMDEGGCVSGWEGGGGDEERETDPLTSHWLL